MKLVLVLCIYLNITLKIYLALHSVSNTTSVLAHNKFSKRGRMNSTPNRRIIKKGGQNK